MLPTGCLDLCGLLPPVVSKGARGDAGPYFSNFQPFSFHGTHKLLKFVAHPKIHFFGQFDKKRYNFCSFTVDSYCVDCYFFI